MALWSGGDAITALRLNRLALGSRMAMPVYDVNGAGAVTVTPGHVDSVLLTGVSTDLLLFTATATPTVLTQYTLNNVHTATVAVRLFLLPEGVAEAANAYCVFSQFMPAKSVVEVDTTRFLQTGDKLVSRATVASQVRFAASWLAFDAQPFGAELVMLSSVTLSTTTALIYTVPTIGVTHAVLVSFLLANNSDTLDNDPHVYHVPSGQTRGAQHAIYSSKMYPKSLTVDDTRRILLPGDTIHAVGSSSSAPSSIRLTIVELT
jgi:hypothetical protein